MPRKDRFDVLQNIYNGLNHGGAFIFAEKTVCEDSRLQEMITFNFYDYKRKHFEASDILEKERLDRLNAKEEQFLQNPLIKKAEEIFSSKLDKVKVNP